MKLVWKRELPPVLLVHLKVCAFVRVFCLDDQAVVKAMLQQLFAVARQCSSAVEICRDVARDIHCCLGDVDQVGVVTTLNPH